MWFKTYIISPKRQKITQFGHTHRDLTGYYTKECLIRAKNLFQTNKLTIIDCLISSVVEQMSQMHGGFGYGNIVLNVKIQNILVVLWSAM